MPHLYYSILTTLSEAPHGCLRMTDLAEALKITRSRLTYAVTRLERDGAVRREGCRLDKRGSLAFLTDEGMALMERTAPGHIATVHACLFEHLTERQVGQLEKICTEVARALQGGRGADRARRPSLAAPLLHHLHLHSLHTKHGTPRPLLQL